MSVLLLDNRTTSAARGFSTISESVFCDIADVGVPVARIDRDVNDCG